MKEEIINLANAYGYVLIEPQKNPYMISFKKEEHALFRINVYYTSMTVQIQSFQEDRSGGDIRKNVDINQFEDILIKYAKLETL